MAHDERAMHRSVTTTRAPLPVLRAAVFAVVGTVLGVSAHHLLAEGPVPWTRGAAATAVLFAVGLVGVQRPRSLATVVACSVAGQSGLHLWLTLTAAAQHSGGHAHGGRPAWHEQFHGSLAMTAAHALAATAVAVLLHRADAVCWRLARGLSAAVEGVRARVAVVRTLLSGRRPVVPVRPAVILVRLERPPPEGAVLADVVVRRGPPAGFVLAH